MNTKSFVRYLATGEYAPAADAASADIAAARFSPPSASAVAEDAAAKYLALAQDDFVDMKTHDDRFHGGHFDPATMKCSLRRKFDKTDAEMDTLTGEERSRATSAENAEAMTATAKYVKTHPNDKWNPSSEPVNLDDDGEPFNGEDWRPAAGDNLGRCYKDGKPLTGVQGDTVYINGYGFHGVIEGRFWRGGKVLAPTFQPGGTKSKYRLMRNALIARTIDKGDHTADLETGEEVTYSDGYQLAFQTSTSEDPSSPHFVSDERYDELTEQMIRDTGSRPHLGIYGVPEISFREADEKKAKNLAFVKYNQEAVLNWATRDLEFNDSQDTSTNSVYNK